MTGGSGITEERRAQFLRDGYLHLRQFIPAPICDSARNEVWRATALSPNEPEAWPEGWTLQPGYDFSKQQPALKSLMTPVFECLAGQELFHWVAIEGQAFHPIVIFPYKSETPWRSPLELEDLPDPKFKDMHPHLDVYDVNLGKSRLQRKWLRLIERRRLSFTIRDRDCNSLILAFVIYLHDVPEHAGATVLWPGSHIEIEDQALTTNRRPLAVVGQGFRPETPFYEAAGGQGDLIVYARNLLHSSSMNRSPTPRCALQGRILLTPDGIRHCRQGVGPRTIVERIYDRHFAHYRRYHYFGT